MQAIILAGGKATRMRPYTDERPKAMVEVAGTPIVEHQIRWLAGSGVTEVVLSCGYKSEVLQEHVGGGSRWGVAVTYAVEPEPLGRGGGLKFAAGHLPRPGETCCAVNGDIICRARLEGLLDHHRALGTAATIALAPCRTTWGVADLEGDLIRGFVQSPVLPYWINGGIYALEPECVDLLPDKGDHEDSTFPELARAGRLGGYRLDAYWRGIDTVKDVLEASRELEEPTGA